MHDVVARLSTKGSLMRALYAVMRRTGCARLSFGRSVPGALREGRPQLGCRMPRRLPRQGRPNSDRGDPKIDVLVRHRTMRVWWFGALRLLSSAIRFRIADMVQRLTTATGLNR